MRQINSVETTLFGCQCCPRPGFHCNEEICNGGKEFRYQSELLKGCLCIDPEAEGAIYGGEIFINPASPILSPISVPVLHQGRSTTPTELPPTAEELQKWGGLYRGVLVYGVQWLSP
jgi:hypothetical protein